ncbi:MAG: dihydroorotate dehydrogenase electron transfer subunit [Thermoleophilaceae bacterium]|nr:dihydroorotate dehydrogenase electron transfer subunit [Thermoleophilaceae bacterium]
MSRRTLAPFGRRVAEVTAVEEVGAYMVISARDDDGPRDPRPGQFYMLSTVERWGGGADERPYLPRAFSFARVRPDGTLDFMLEAIGPGTGRLAELEPGEGLGLVGPLGIGFDLHAPGRALLVGGGIGAAPIVALQDELGPEARVLLGFRSAAHAEAAGLFFAADPNVVTDDGSVGRQAFVTELLREELDADADATVFACGPPAMLEAVRALCAERAVPAQLALESGMACGYGACFGCVVPTREGYVRLCVDGPVLAADRLETALIAGTGH